MIVQKKISKNKILICIIIFSLMIVGSIFFYYKIREITSKDIISTINTLDYNIIDNEKKIAEEVKFHKEELKDSNEKILNIEKKIGLDVVSSVKFKKLKENVIVYNDFAVGKKDLFESFDKE